MPKVTDEELDRLFREAAESTHPEFDPGDWDDMSQKLAREEKAARGRNRTLYSVVTLLVLYSLWSPFGDRKLQNASMNPLAISEFSVKEKSNGSQATNATEESEISVQPATEVGQNDSNASDSKPADQEIKSIVVPETNGAVSTNVQSLKSESKDRTSVHRATRDVAPSGTKNRTAVTASVADSDLQNKSTAGVANNAAVNTRAEVAAASPTIAGSGDQASSPVDGNSNQPGPIAQNGINSLATESLIKDNDSRNDNRTLPTVKNEVVEINKGAELSANETEKDVDSGGFKSLAEQSESAGEVNQTEPTQASLPFPMLAPTRERKLPLLVEAENTKKVISAVHVERPAPTEGETVVKKDALQSNHPWYIKLPVSPDFSSIDYGSAGKTGINIGLIGEYYLTKHISISTGAIWSKKLYDQTNPDKVYNAGTWTAKVSKLDGDCRVLDIPLNFTYYLFPERRTNFFVTVGSSSYIMLNEDYKYTIWKNQQYMTYDQQISHENNEWFSMLNVSIGIQQRVGPRFMFQVEPFLKAPMSGVGEGKVNLVSTGAFVSLKYQLTK